MATVSENLERMVQARKDIITAINDKGVECVSTEKLSALPAKIAAIKNTVKVVASATFSGKSFNSQIYSGFNGDSTAMSVSGHTITIHRDGILSCLMNVKWASYNITIKNGNTGDVVYKTNLTSGFDTTTIDCNEGDVLNVSMPTGGDGSSSICSVAFIVIE